MYKKTHIDKTAIRINNSLEGETIEAKVRRIMNNNEPISDGAPILYTERNEGVKPEYDIRTDRFEVAIDAMDSLHSEHIAKRMERHKPLTEPPAADSIAATAGGTANT